MIKFDLYLYSRYKKYSTKYIWYIMQEHIGGIEMWDKERVWGKVEVWEGKVWGKGKVWEGWCRGRCGARGRGGGRNYLAPRPC